MTSLKTSIKTITYLSDIGCLEIQGASLTVYVTPLATWLNRIRKNTVLFWCVADFPKKVTAADHDTTELQLY